MMTSVRNGGTADVSNENEGRRYTVAGDDEQTSSEDGGTTGDQPQIGFGRYLYLSGLFGYRERYKTCRYCFCGERENNMLSVLFVIFMMVILFKLAGFVLRIAGRLLGGILGIIGYLFLGILAVTALGLAAFALPVILVIGAGCVAGLIAKT